MTAPATITQVTASPVTGRGDTHQPGRPRSAVPRILLYVAMIIVGLAAIIPIYWLLSSSVKTSGQIFVFPPRWFPTSFHWENFVEAWHSAPFGRMYINSVVVTIFGTLGEICVAVLSSYAFVFLPFPRKNLIFGIFLGAMMVPGTVVLLPNYMTVAQLGWVNTYAGLIVPGWGSVFAMFLLRQHMMTLPAEITEAARVDGAGHLRTLWSIVLPLSRPMVVTVMIVSLVSKWNDFIWPLIVTNTDNMRVLPVGLLMLKSDEGYTDWGAVMAATCFVVIPVLVVFFFAQRQIVAGLTQGATKG
ncbi:carbohydrate ABC transporter permease [Microlunatus sp. Gsoil 973]|uniref:carbohydrate ABC transporter permease n=1 Tax=Microlunatus sp. Gsoil 973 TaxID=2672569 RepID=UPI001E2962AD|nr:carbohydrate ABC transporter permease [Microlunatus sp. Gsoil 973]